MFYYVRKVSIYTHVHQVWSLNSRWHFTTHGIRPWISRRFFLGVSIIFEFHSSNFRGVYPPGKNKPQLLVVFFPGPEGWLFPGAFSFGHTVGGNGIDAERSGKFDSYNNHYHRNWKKSIPAHPKFSSHTEREDPRLEPLWKGVDSSRSSPGVTGCQRSWTTQIRSTCLI